MLHYRAMQWDWKSIVLVAVLSICILVLIAPNFDLEQSALRAIRWIQIFFALLTGLLMVLSYLQSTCISFLESSRPEAQRSTATLT